MSLPIGEGQENPLLIFLRDNITHVALTTKYDPPYQSTTYIESLEQDDSEIGRIVVTPTIRNGVIILNYTLGFDDCNCSQSSVVSVASDNKTFTLSDATSFKEAGGDRVECVRLTDGVYEELGDSRDMSRSGSIIVLQDSFLDVTHIRLKISRGAVVLNGESTPGTGQVMQNGWFVHKRYKDSSTTYTMEEQIFLK